MSETVPYASQQPTRRGSAIWAAAVLGFIGLGLIGLGGCFLIGVGLVFDIFSITDPATPKVLTMGEMGFVCILYACTAGCVIGAIAVLVLSVRMLLRVGSV